MLSGMDIGQIRSLVRVMVRGCVDLRGMIRDLTVDVERAPWRGPDRDRFVEQWNGHHVVRLNRVAEGLEDAAGEAERHASRQEEASRR